MSDDIIDVDGLEHEDDESQVEDDAASQPAAAAAAFRRKGHGEFFCLAQQVYDEAKTDPVEKWLSFLRDACIVDEVTGCWRARKGVPHLSWQTREKRFNVRFAQWARVHLGCTLEGATLLSYAARVLPFLCGELKVVDGKPLCASHLCHTADCLCPAHIVVESQWINVQRSYCTAAQCVHVPRCLRDGTDAARQLVPALTWNSVTQSYAPAQ